MIALTLLKRFWPELVGFLVVVALVFAWTQYTAKLEKAGYDRGVKDTQADYALRDNKQLREALVAQAAAEKRANAAEAKAAAAQTLATTNYQKGVKDANDKTASRLAAVDAGTLRLRDPGQIAACPSVSDSAGKTQAASPVPGGNGQTGGNLSTAASQFLLSLTGEADQLARQLALAQEVITSDRELCNIP